MVENSEHLNLGNTLVSIETSIKRLIEDGALRTAVLNVGATVALGLIAAAAGMTVGRSI